MNRIKYIGLLGIVMLAFLVKAQDVTSNIETAKNSYSAQNYDQARVAIQQAMAELNKKVANEVIALLPQTINQFSCQTSQDMVSGWEMGLMSLMVSRNWDSETNSISFSVMGNSPLVASINAALSMPMMMGAGNPNQKKTNIEGYKALLEKQVDENQQISGYSLMVPFQSSLIQLNYSGPIAEQDFLNIVAQIPVSKITQLMQ